MDILYIIISMRFIIGYILIRFKNHKYRDIFHNRNIMICIKIVNIGIYNRIITIVNIFEFHQFLHGLGFVSLLLVGMLRFI